MIAGGGTLPNRKILDIPGLQRAHTVGLPKARILELRATRGTFESRGASRPRGIDMSSAISRVKSSSDIRT